MSTNERNLITAMDLLVAEPLEPDVLDWLQQRLVVDYRPRLTDDPSALAQALGQTRAAILPARVRIDARVLRLAPHLRAIGRVVGGPEHIDYQACTLAGVELVRCPDSTAPAEAEFLLGAILSLLRPSPMDMGQVAGRELARSTVGMIGVTAAAQKLVPLLRTMGTQVVGYDPTVHAQDPRWSGWGIRPLSLNSLFAACDAVCVLLPGFSRYHGLLGERSLGHCRPGQVLVSLSPSALFDEAALARVLGSGRLAAAWLDQADLDLQAPGRILAGMRGLMTTPMLAGYTRESRNRSAWGVARRIEQILREQAEACPSPEAHPVTPEGAPPTRPSLTAVEPRPQGPTLARTLGAEVPPQLKIVKPAADAAAAASPRSH